MEEPSKTANLQRWLWIDSLPLVEETTPWLPGGDSLRTTERERRSESESESEKEKEKEKKKKRERERGRVWRKLKNRWRQPYPLRTIWPKEKNVSKKKEKKKKKKEGKTLVKVSVCSGFTAPLNSLLVISIDGWVYVGPGSQIWCPSIMRSNRWSWVGFTKNRVVSCDKCQHNTIIILTQIWHVVDTTYRYDVSCIMLT